MPTSSIATHRCASSHFLLFSALMTAEEPIEIYSNFLMANQNGLTCYRTINIDFAMRKIFDCSKIHYSDNFNFFFRLLTLFRRNSKIELASWHFYDLFLRLFGNYYDSVALLSWKKKRNFALSRGHVQLFKILKRNGNRFLKFPIEINFWAFSCLERWMVEMWLWKVVYTMPKKLNFFFIFF